MEGEVKKNQGRGRSTKVNGNFFLIQHISKLGPNIGYPFRNKTQKTWQLWHDSKLVQVRVFWTKSRITHLISETFYLKDLKLRFSHPKINFWNERFGSISEICGKLIKYLLNVDFDLKCRWLSPTFRSYPAIYGF